MKLFLSQEIMAKELGVAFSSVNRWENGRFQPGFKAQKAFYELCKKNNIEFEEWENSYERIDCKRYKY